MLRHRLKTGDLTSRSERNAALIRTLSGAFRDRHKEYTNLRILASNEETLLATKSCDVLHHLCQVKHKNDKLIILKKGVVRWLDPL